MSVWVLSVLRVILFSLRNFVVFFIVFMNLIEVVYIILELFGEFLVWFESRKGW